MYAAALAGLPRMNPRRLVKVLDGFGPLMAWRAVEAGAHPADPGRRFASAARRTDVHQVGERLKHLGVHTLLPDGRGYPSALVGDPGAPAVLFALGDPMVLECGPRVAIVGTRSATHYGRRVASELAGVLAAEGIAVVSGLASGIDAAAHAGALRATEADVAPAIAVVGTGLDVVYPSSSRELWDEMATRGVVFSEAPLGTQPHPGVFPARNRIIAALADVVVVVESHARGGALYTAEAAARRSIPVCAVPGSVHSRASAGSNALLVDGCIPVRDADDVKVALSLVRAGKNLAGIRNVGRNASSHRTVGSVRMTSARSKVRDRTDGPVTDGPVTDGPVTDGPVTDRGSDDAGKAVAVVSDGAWDGASEGASDGRTDRRATATSKTIHQLQTGSEGPLTPSQQALLEAVDDTPTAFETILIRTDLSISAAAEACDQLVERGILRVGAGWWSTA